MAQLQLLMVDLWQEVMLHVGGGGEGEGQGEGEGEGEVRRCLHAECGVCSV